MSSVPNILYSFRRCPYAMRARLAIQSSGIEVQLREIVLCDKPTEFLASSPKGTVPVIVTHNEVVDESLDIMIWALEQSDPEGWLKMPDAGYDWIYRNDGQFKAALDHTKYSVRHPNLDIHLEREKAANFLHDLNNIMSKSAWMFGENCSLADIAILPFVRQFSNIDRVWFNAQSWRHLNHWLTTFLNSNRFKSIMTRYDKWVVESPVILFPS